MFLFGTLNNNSSENADAEPPTDTVDESEADSNAIALDGEAGASEGDLRAVNVVGEANGDVQEEADGVNDGLDHVQNTGIKAVNDEGALTIPDALATPDAMASVGEANGNILEETDEVNDGLDNVENTGNKAANYEGALTIPDDVVEAEERTLENTGILRRIPTKKGKRSNPIARRIEM